jgi:hypothetical protein
MGLEIKKNKKGLYKVTNTISGEKVFEEPVPVEEVKKLLIERTIWKCIEDVCRIDHDFPNGWTVNDKRSSDKKHKFFNEVWLEQVRHGEEKLGEFITTQFGKIMDTHNLTDEFIEILKK